jgi:zinc-binding alcohol dehydrogenase/oxidoreductase
MKALQLDEKNTPPVYRELPDLEPAEGEVLVHIKAAALNRRDVWIMKGMYPGLKFPITPGSDGAGLCQGKEVIINPSIHWGDNPAIQGPKYEILGLPRNGTLATAVLVPEKQLYDKPVHLTWEEAAALPLAGLTAYRAVFSKAKVQAGERVLVTGIGGGVALFALQFALAAGAKVFVTSGSESKIDRARELGASGGVNYRNTDWLEALRTLAGSFDVVIDGAGGEGLAGLLKRCNPGARVVIYGGTRGTVPELSPQLIFWKQLQILGTSMGTDAEFADMLDFVNEHQIRPVVDQVFHLSEGISAFDHLERSEQFGKVVLKP